MSRPIIDPNNTAAVILAAGTVAYIAHRLVRFICEIGGIL